MKKDERLTSEDRAVKTKTIVSITPLKVEADSRTFKQAASTARLGYTSIVVEGEKSLLDLRRLPFELRTVKWRSEHERRSRAARDPLAETPIGNDVSPIERPSLTEPTENPHKRTVSSLASFTWSRWRIAGATWSPRRPLAREVWTSIGRPAARTAYRAGRRVYRTIRTLALFARAVLQYLYLYGLLPLRCAPPASLYYLHAFYQFPAVYLLCWRHRASYIYDAHDFYSQLEDPPAVASAWEWMLRFYLVIEGWCVRNAAAVVTVNEGIAGLIEERFHRRATVVRNAHDARLDRRPSRDLRESLGLTGGDFLLVSVGNAKPGMTIREPILALRDLPPHVHLAFVGGGYTDYEVLGRENVPARVHFVPAVPPDEVVPFISTADAAAVLYYAKSIDYRYSLPNRFFQSIAARLPLLYPDLPEIRRLAERYEVGIMVDPRSPMSIRDALRQLLDDPALARKLRANLDVAQHELAWEREEEVLRRLLRDVLGGTAQA